MAIWAVEVTVFVEAEDEMGAVTSVVEEIRKLDELDNDIVGFAHTLDATKQETH